MLKYNDINTCDLLAYQLFVLIPGKAPLKLIISVRRHNTQN